MEIRRRRVGRDAARDEETRRIGRSTRPLPDDGVTRSLAGFSPTHDPRDDSNVLDKQNFAITIGLVPLWTSGPRPSPTARAPCALLDVRPSRRSAAASRLLMVSSPLDRGRRGAAEPLAERGQVRARRPARRPLGARRSAARGALPRGRWPRGGAARRRGVVVAERFL